MIWCKTPPSKTIDYIENVFINSNPDHSCTLSDRIYVEAIGYSSTGSMLTADQRPIDERQFTVDKINEYIEGKTLEYFCLKCYETNTIALIPMEEQLFRIEQRLKAIELILKTVRCRSIWLVNQLLNRINSLIYPIQFSFWFIARNWSVPFMLMLIVFAFTLIASWINYTMQVSSHHASTKNPPEYNSTNS